MLARIRENLAREQAGTQTEPESSAVVLSASPGDRLEAGLVADQQWRRTREEELREGLRKVRLFEGIARSGCVTAGLLEWVILPLALLAWIAPGSAWFTAAALLIPGFAATLTVSGGLAVTALLWRARLLKQAKRDAVSVPAENYEPVTEAEIVPTDPERDRRCRLLQQEVEQVYDDENVAGEVCLWAGYGSLGSCPLLLSGWMALYPIAFLAWAGIIIVLPFAAVVCAYKGRRRRRLMEQAASEGLEIRNPAFGS